MPDRTDKGEQSGQRNDRQGICVRVASDESRLACNSFGREECLKLTPSCQWYPDERAAQKGEAGTTKT